MNLTNRTDGKHLALPMKASDGSDRLVVIVKYTYREGPRGAMQRDSDGVPPRAVDVPNGDDADLANSSIQFPSDVCDFKPGTDVILVGEAHGRPGAAYAEVSLRVGSIHKTVRAHGVRAWQRGMLGGLVPGPAMPLRGPVPIVYELAWGGLDLSVPDKPVGEPRNYVGRGVAREPRMLVGQAAAQLELADKPLGERGNVPASFGAIHRHWAPRASFVGTYDPSWQTTRMPLLPADFDARHHVCVPHDQWSPAPLAPDTPIEVTGATESGVWRIALPADSPRFSSIVRGQRTEHRAHLDTILVDARARSVELTWRAAIPAPSKLELIDEVRIQ